MFSRKNQPLIKGLVAKGACVQGDISFGDGLRIDGEIHGDVRADSERSVVVISDSATVQGAVQAAHVIINGTVKARYMPVNCWNCSRVGVSQVMCITRCLKCTRVPSSPVSCARARWCSKVHHN